jgi:hypothetical protein
MHLPAIANSHQFEVPTHDGRTRLRGQLDLPHEGTALRYPAVVIVNGGWFMERDGYMGNSGTEKDLVYRELARAIVATGVAVARYDNRGVRCNEMTMPPCRGGSGELEISRHYIDACVDNDLRETVTVQTQMDDVEAVWHFVLRHPKMDPTAMVILAHSEGALNAARLIGARRIDPRGILMIGSGAGSPADTLRWQMVDHCVAHLMSWDADGDGRITQADVDRQLPADPIFPLMAMGPAELASPPEGWTRDSAHILFLRIYEEKKAAALAKPDTAPYPDQWGDFRMVAASHAWYRQWLVDTTPMIDHLAGYTGHASFHFGGIDSQAPGALQMAVAEKRIKSGIFARPPRLTLHPDRGHSLRTGEPSAGPMDPEARAALVREIGEILKAG